MSTLFDRTIAESYKELLKTASTGGVNSSLTIVEDGDATASALQISTTTVKSSGSLEVVGPATLTSTLSVTGASTLTGNVSMGGDLTVAGNAVIQGTLTANGGTLTLGDADTDNVVFNADINSHILPNTDNTYDLGSAAKSWRNLHVDGTATLNNISITGSQTVSATTQSTDKDTGALVVEGGVGVEKNVNVGGSLAVTGTTGLTGNTSVTGTLGVANTISATLASGTGLAVTANATIGGTLGVTGNSSFGAITAGTWQGTIINPTYGGTGVNNGSKTITLGGNLTTSGAFATTLVSTANTDVTLPTTGTLATLANTETLTNKTLTSPVISSISNTGTLTLPTSTDTLIGRATTDTLTNKTLTSPVISSIVNTGTLTLPTSTDTLVGRATTDTLANKTLTSPVISSISNTGTITLPTSTDTLVGRATTDTLTNKTINLANNTLTATSLQIATAVSDETGSGSLVFANSPTLTTPNISSIVNTGTLSLPTSTDTLVGRATTDTLTNKTINLSSNTLQATSAELATAISDETGTGSLVFANSPTLVTPTLGAASATSLSLGTPLSPANGGTGLSTTSAAAAGKILGVAPNGSSHEYKTLTPGTGISITDSAGIVTITNTGSGSAGGGGGSASGAVAIYRYNATAGQTVFSGVDTSSSPTSLLYVQNYVNVFLNGVKLDDSDFTATDGTSITLNVPCVATDDVDIVAFGAVPQLANAGGLPNYVVGTTAGGTALEYKQIVAGTGVSIAQGVGSLTISAGGSPLSAPLASFRYIASANQTVFTGIDTNGNPLGFTPGFLYVFVNGVLLAPSLDYTTTSTTTITLTSGCSLSDFIDILAFGQVNTFGLVDGSVTTAKLNLLTGNVGIGTASPATKLHIATSGTSSIDETLRLENSSNTSSNGNKITWRNAGQTTECAFISGLREGASTSFALAIGTSPNFTSGGTNAVERLRIDSSGRVGIGTTSPLKELQINATEPTIRLEESSGGSKRLELSVNSSAEAKIFANQSGGTLILGTVGTERLRIDSSGNVGIGTTSPATKLTVSGSSGTGSELRVVSTTANTGGKVTLYENTSPCWEINAPSGANGPLTLKDIFNNAERLRIDASGNLLVGKTSPSTSTVGFQFDLANQKIASGANGGASAFFNRNGDDGMIVQIAQDGTVEGTISVSGTTVSYNGGNLSRFSQLPSGQRDPAIKKGTVLSNLDAMCEWRDADGNLLPNEQLNKVKISDVEGDSNTAGVFVNWDNDDQDNPYDLNMAMTGDMIIRIAQGTSVNRGDLLMSAGDGTAKPQGDDIIRSKTIAKVTSTNVTCTYEDGSYCVPCVLMAC